MTRRAPATTWLVRTAAAAFGAVAMLMTGATAAWAPHVAQLQVTPSQVKPGQQVTVYGPRGYARTNPVEVRWNSPTGPVLGTFQPNEESYAQFGPGPVTIPADARPGTYQLFATQQLTPADTYIRGIPSHATVEVVGVGGAPTLGAGPAPQSQPEAVGLEKHEGVDSGRFAIIAFGVAGIALFLAGAGAILASRRGRSAPAAEAERVNP